MLFFYCACCNYTSRICFCSNILFFKAKFFFCCSSSQCLAFSSNIESNCFFSSISFFNLRFLSFIYLSNVSLIIFLLLRKSSFYFYLSSSNFSLSNFIISCHSSPERSDAIESASNPCLLYNFLSGYTLKSAKLLDVSEIY